MSRHNLERLARNTPHLNSGTHTRNIAACLFAFLTMAMPAAAQDANGTVTDASDSVNSGAIEEIVVTSQRRVQNLQDVASAALVIAGDDLDGKAVTRLDELQNASPALSITDFGLSQNVNIRGVGLASGNPGISNGVATYIDGLFQPPIVTTNSFYDIAAIEVFRGPQGTFVGSNSTGGAIFINSRNPEFDVFEGYVEVNAGNYGEFGLEGAINIPVSDTLALRVAGIYRDRDSFYDDLGPFNNEMGSLDENAVRLGIRFEPNEQFKALWKTEVGEKKVGGYAQRPLPSSSYAAFVPDDIFDLSYDAETRGKEEYLQTSLDLSIETAGGTRFRLLSGYQDKEATNFNDIDASLGAPSITEDLNPTETVWTEEINIISPDEGRLSWIIGAYFQRNEIFVDIQERTDGFPVDIEIDITKETTGFFAHAYYQLTDTLELEAGIRHNSFENEDIGGVYVGRGLPFPPFNFDPLGLRVADISNMHDDDGVSGKVGIKWAADENHNVYGFIARGYKPGGGDENSFEFDPEFVIDYEFGLKSDWHDGAIQTQLSAFYYDYEAFQFEVLNLATGQQSVTNLSDSEIYGLEGQFVGEFDRLRIDGGFAYVESELGEAIAVDQRAFNAANPGAPALPQCTGGAVPPTCIDYTPWLATVGGGPNLFAPEWTLNVGIEYDIPVGNNVVRPRLNYAYVGEQEADIFYGVDSLIDSRSLLSAQLTIELEALTVELYGTNLTDETYVTGQNTRNQFYGSPRQYGIRLQKSF